MTPLPRKQRHKSQVTTNPGTSSKQQAAASPKNHSNPNRRRGPQCLNIHALGEQWIEEVTDVEVVQTSQEECLEAEHLKFKAHIRGWKTEIRKERCRQLLDKNDNNLRRALLRPLWKDVLLIPQALYPEHKPRYETQGWWYVPAEEILGRECKSCSRVVVFVI
jgi:hypothetical protein